MEDTGQCRRGYFVEGLGAAQFALPGAVDRMRAMAGTAELAAGWPADRGRLRPAGRHASAQISCWRRRPGATPTAPRCPARAARRRQPGGHRPGRKAGALVVLSQGGLVLYVERGGKTLLSWSSDPDVLEPAVLGAGRRRAGRARSAS